MSRDLGMLDVPSARRASAAGWRDPRLWVGVALVAASMLVGARVLGTSDDTVPVWAAADSMGPGHTLQPDDLTVRRVDFAEASAAGVYLSASRPPPAGVHLVRAVAAGELLPRAAIGSGAATDLQQVPAAVAADQVPQGVRRGDVVDVYLRPATRAGCSGTSVCDGRPVLSGVTVLEAPQPDQGFGAEGARMLVLGVPDVDAHRYFRLLAATDNPSLTVVGRG